MKSNHILFLILLFLFIFSVPIAAPALTVDISATVPGCGDGVIGSGEQCDGSDLGGASCISRSFSGGTLSCTASCTFNTTACTSGGGGGGGGGGSSSSSSSSTTATAANTTVFSGRAYPNSTIVLLKDAQMLTSTVAGGDANFTINVNNLSAGNYLFSIYSEDNLGNRSSLLTFPVSITASAGASISGIFIAPTIIADKSQVKKGDNITFFGQSTPLSEISILVNSEQEIFKKTNSDQNGIYLQAIDSSELDFGDHTAKSKIAREGQISSYSKVFAFEVGNQNILIDKTKKCPAKGDLNSDCKTSLVDFSIEAFWYKKSSHPAKVDLNSDGIVNLIDFSIMAYYWTG